MKAKIKCAFCDEPAVVRTKTRMSAEQSNLCSKHSGMFGIGCDINLKNMLERNVSFPYIQFK